MKKVWQSLSSILPFATVALLTLSMIVARQEKSEDDAKNKITREKIQVHGGQGTISKKFCFETIFRKDGIRIYVYNAKAEPILTVGLGGAVLMKPKEADLPEKDLALKTFKSSDRSVREYLYADVDLSKSAKNSFTAQITITGLKEDGAKEVAFEVPFLGLTKEISYWCPKCEASFADPGNCSKCGSDLERKAFTEASGSEKPD